MLIKKLYHILDLIDCINIESVVLHSLRISDTPLNFLNFLVASEVLFCFQSTEGSFLFPPLSIHAPKIRGRNH